MQVGSWEAQAMEVRLARAMRQVSVRLEAQVLTRRE